MGASQNMMTYHEHINDAVLQEMDRLGERDKGRYDPDILTTHVIEAIGTIHGVKIKKEDD